MLENSKQPAIEIRYSSIHLQSSLDLVVMEEVKIVKADLNNEYHSECIIDLLDSD